MASLCLRRIKSRCTLAMGAPGRVYPTGCQGDGEDESVLLGSGRLTEDKRSTMAFNKLSRQCLVVEHDSAI